MVVSGIGLLNQINYSEEKYDNIAVMKKNIEKRFLLDYLKAEFTNDISKEIVYSMNANYILPFYNLYEHCSLAEEKEKADKYKGYIKLLYKQTGYGKELIDRMEK